MEIKEPDLRPGKMCAIRAPSGSFGGRRRSAVWLEVMLDPSGMVTLMPVDAGWMLVTGQSGVT